MKSHKEQAHSPQGNIKAILFDFMGVLMFQRKDYEANHLVDSVDALIGRVIHDGEFEKDIMNKFDLDRDKAKEIYRSIADKYEPYQPLWEMLPNLRKRYKLGIINNGTYLTFRDFDNKLNLSDTFDIHISSGREGVRKPDPAIYMIACQRLEVEPKECVFMDDTEENIAGAQKIGMKTIYWKNPDKGMAGLLQVINEY